MKTKFRKNPRAIVIFPEICERLHTLLSVSHIDCTIAEAPAKFAGGKQISPSTCDIVFAKRKVHFILENNASTDFTTSLVTQVEKLRHQFGK